MKRSVAGRQEKPEFTPQTELGKRLWARRRAYIANGGKLLGWDDLERELADRKGKAR